MALASAAVYVSNSPSVLQQAVVPLEVGKVPLRTSPRTLA